MTLLAILILLQTPSLHLGGPDAAIPRRDRGNVRIGRSQSAIALSTT